VRSSLAVTASLAAAPLLTLGEELERLKDAGVEGIHLDVEDGVFVPAMNLGLRLVEEIARWGKLPIDVHLMVENPEGVLELLPDLPLRRVSVHLESTRYPRRVLRKVAERGYRPGLAINPATPPPALRYLSPHIEHLLVLSTEPEAGSAPHLPGVVAQLGPVVSEAHELGLQVIVDGAVDGENADSIAAQGADGAVVGRALFSSPDIHATVRRIAQGEPNA